MTQKIFNLGRRWNRAKKEGRHDYHLRMIEQDIQVVTMGTDDPLGDWHGRNL